MDHLALYPAMEWERASLRGLDRRRTIRWANPPDGQYWIDDAFRDDRGIGMVCEEMAGWRISRP